MARTPNDDRADTANPDSSARAASEADMERQIGNEATPTPPKDPRMFFDAPLIASVQDKDSHRHRPPRKNGE